MPGDDEPDPEESISAAAAGFGLVIEGSIDLVEEKCFLWPENVEIFRFWQSVQTQWVISDGRIHRLHYEGVKICLEYWAGIRKKDRPEVWLMLQAMERATLEEWSD